MSKRSSTLLYALMALVVSLSMLLSACTTPQAPTVAATQAPAKEEPTKPPEPTALPAAEITYYYPGAPQADLQAVNDAMNVILQKKINATIKLVQLDWGAYDEKMKLMFQSQEPCDIVFTAPWINNYFQLVNGESLLALDDLLPKYAPDLYAQIKPEFWNAVRVNGKIYSIPNQQIWVKPWGFAAREDIATKYKFDWQAVTKWEQLTPFLDNIKKGEPDMIAWEAAPPFRPEIYHWDPIDEGLGGEMGSIIAVNALQPDLKAFNVSETPEFKQFVELMYQWYQAGYIPKEKDPDPTTSWKAGKYVLWSHLIDPRMRAWEKRNRGWDFIGKPLTDPIIMTTGSVIATLNAVCSSSKNPERAVMFLNLINSDVELFNLMNYGIEGKHWVWVDKAKKLIGPPAGKTWQETGYYPDTLWEYGSNWLAYYASPEDAEGDTWTKVKAVNDNSTPSQALGFTFSREKVQTEIANVNAAVTEFCGPLVGGTLDPATGLQPCIDKVKEAGVDKIIAEMQIQLDAFKAAKK